MVEFDIKRTAADWYDYLLMHNYNSSWGIVVSTFGALILIGGLNPEKQGWAVVGIMVLLALPVWLYLKSRKQSREPGFQKLLHYVMDEDGVTITNGDIQEKLLWGEIHKAVSTNKSFVLYTAKDVQVLSKRDLGEQRAAVIEMISIHMPPANVKIKQ